MFFLTPRYLKQAKLLERHARKVLRYKQDVLPPVQLESLRTRLAKLKATMRKGRREEIEEAAHELDHIVHEITPTTWESHWRENVEVILVAVVVAVGIRSYFLQPFKIPTGSMQPTLNGIIGYPTAAASNPNALVQAIELVVFGRNYINVVSKRDDQVERIVPRKFGFFFTFSTIQCRYQRFLVWCPPEQLKQDFRVLPGNTYASGQIIARGAVDTGDQVFVDKLTYNFVKPSRGDVFVFRTDGIFGMQAAHPSGGSQFYIKRLAGLPGDKLEIKPPLLYVNGKLAEDKRFQMVMSARFPFRGYSVGNEFGGSPTAQFEVGDGYFALGDNSYNSYDSRYWGAVPLENLVGRGLFVYWPFGRHWGLIR